MRCNKLQQIALTFLPLFSLLLLLVQLILDEACNHNSLAVSQQGLKYLREKGWSRESSVKEHYIFLLFYRPELLLGQFSAGYTRETQADT